jgi:cytochrome c5
MKRELGLLLGVGILSLLSACENKPDTGGDASPNAVNPPNAAQIAFASNAAPTDPALAAVYERSCKTCHSAINTNAPLTGHTQAWRTRIAAKGEAALLVSVQNGLNAMPAKGLCPDCTDEQFKALTVFMSTGGK